MAQGRRALPRINVGQMMKFRNQTHVILEIRIKEGNKLVIYTEEKNQHIDKVRIESDE